LRHETLWEATLALALAAVGRCIGPGFVAKASAARIPDDDSIHRGARTARHRTLTRKRKAVDMDKKLDFALA
jgi:hypothetical protein